MTSSALLTDVGHTSSGLLVTLVGVAFIGLVGVTFVFLMVSPKLIYTFLVLPNPTPYSELELLSLYQRFLDLLLTFLRVFLSLSNFSLSTAQSFALRDQVSLRFSWRHGNWVSSFHPCHTYDNLLYCA
jgi:hypothetical protein